MNPRLLLKEKHDLLKNELWENLQRKRTLELKINVQFEDLKKLEILLEKGARKTPARDY